MDIRRTVTSWATSLSGRMLISILLIHLVLLSALFYTIIKLVEDNYMEQFIDDVRIDSQRVSQLILFQLENHNQQQLNQLSDNLLLGGQLVSIVIKDDSNNVIYPDKEAYEKKSKFLEDFFFGGNNDDLYCIKNRLVTQDGFDIGALQLAYEELSTREEINKLYRGGIVIAASYIFIILVFMGIVDTYLTQPLRNLTRDANHIASGKYNERFSITTNVNEVKNLAESLELMRNELVNRGEKLADREKRIITLVNSIADVVLVCDRKGHLESINQAITFITHYSVGDLLAENIGLIINFEEVLLSINKTPAERIYETTILDKGGEEIPVEVNVSELEQGQRHLLLIVLRDVRERKRSENTRYQYYNDMAHAGRLGIMGEMAAGIAHELNQPLAAISLYLQGCLRRSEPDSISRQEMIYAIKAADEQATRAAGIIRRIKGFVRKEAENENLEIVDINLLIKRSVEFVLLDTKYSSIQPELLLASHPLKAKVDSLEIEQVLVNLIRNAIEAIVFHALTPYFLKIHSNIDTDGNIKVSVIDSGCGIEYKNRDKIFDTYFTTKADGLGMGLAICRSIIEEHDGVLQYKSGEGGGAVFYFSLPLDSM